MNAFDKMQEQNLETFEKGPRQQMRNELTGTLGTIRFLGSVADVYLNRMVDTFIGMAGGLNPKQEEPNPDDGGRSRSVRPTNEGYPNK